MPLPIITLCQLTLLELCILKIHLANIIIIMFRCRLPRFLHFVDLYLYILNLPLGPCVRARASPCPCLPPCACLRPCASVSRCVFVQLHFTVSITLCACRCMCVCVDVSVRLCMCAHQKSMPVCARESVCLCALADVCVAPCECLSTFLCVRVGACVRVTACVFISSRCLFMRGYMSVH